MSRRTTYNKTGHGYESGRYGDSHMDAYRGVRNRTLGTLLDETFGGRSLRILEVGCGTGLTLDYLSRLPARHVLVGSDFSETMLTQAGTKARSQDNPPKLALGDATSLPFRDEGFDVLVATRFIHQFPHATKQRIWREFRRVVRPEGLLVVEFYGRSYHWLRYWLGFSKGRSWQDYFDHYPSRAEVRDVVGQPFRVHPLRLAGSRVWDRSLSEGAASRVTEVAGRALGGVLLDEYFVAARRQ